MKIFSFLAISALLVGTIPVTVIAQSTLTANIVYPENQASFPVNQAITFTGSATGGEPPYAFVWNFGDGTQGGGQTFDKRAGYANPGTYTVLLTVTDFNGQRATNSIQLQITGEDKEELEATITAPENNSTVVVNQPVTFRAEAQGGEGPYAFVWNFGDGTQGGGEPFTKTYTAIGTYSVGLTVTDFNGEEDTDGITVTVVEAEGDLVITNVRVTDITQTTAVVRWTTNRPANSRVIYDTISHPDISQQTPPNFGYAFSTETFDQTNKLIEHAVTVTGLSPNTTYFFRAISQE